MLARRPEFERVSPQTGELDVDAFAQVFEESPDDALGLLADLANVTDAQLKELARRLAGRVIVRFARGDAVARRGIERLRTARWSDSGDLDIDASLDALVEARAARRPPAIDDLRSRDWVKARLAVCLLVDRSGSMGGARLAAAAVAAATVAWRAPHDHSVVAFAGDAIVVKSQDAPRDAEAVVDDLLALKGYGTTNLSLALRVAREQLERSPARRKVVILLSDGRPTAGTDPVVEARRLDQVHVVAPLGDAEDARELARAAGGRCVELAGPSQVPEALRGLIE